MRYCDHLAFFLMIQIIGEWAKTDAGHQAILELAAREARQRKIKRKKSS